MFLRNTETFDTVITAECKLRARCFLDQKLDCAAHVLSLIYSEVDKLHK